MIKLAIATAIALHTTVLKADPAWGTDTFPGSDAKSPAPVYVPKQPWKKRHPKLYRSYRGVVFVCHLIEPPLRVAALAAQIATPFAVK